MIVEEVNYTEIKLIAILKVLSMSSEPVGSTTISHRLEREGIFLSERTVRYHLKIADEVGYTQPFGHDGRMITTEGRKEIKEAMVARQLGSTRNKLKILAYQTTFDPEKHFGRLPINVSLINKDIFKEAVLAMKDAFKAGICVSDLVAVAQEGEIIGSVVIPPGKTGLATVCGVAVNGVLLKSGVPTEYNFGGILEIRSSNPRRFVAIINYDGTSLDPSEEFVRSKMTSVGEASKVGSGKVLGVFRTLPAIAREISKEKISKLREAGIGGVYAIGNSGEPLCQISVALNRIGVVQLSGLNPVAAAVEIGIEIENIAGSGLIEFQQLQHIWKL